MTQVSQEDVDRRVKDRQFRDILKKQFGNEESAVQVAESLEKVMEKMKEECREKIRAEFANVATKADAEDLPKIMRRYIDIVSGKRPGKPESS